MAGSRRPGPGGGRPPPAEHAPRDPGAWPGRRRRSRWQASARGRKPASAPPASPGRYARSDLNADRRSNPVGTRLAREAASLVGSGRPILHAGRRRDGLASGPSSSDFSPGVVPAPFHVRGRPGMSRGRPSARRSYFARSSGWVSNSRASSMPSRFPRRSEGWSTLVGSESAPSSAGSRPTVSSASRFPGHPRRSVRRVRVPRRRRPRPTRHHQGASALAKTLILRLTLRAVELLGEPAEWQLLAKQMRAGTRARGPRRTRDGCAHLAAELWVAVREESLVPRRRRRRHAWTPGERGS
jgi:hypothetical protein